MNNKVSVNEDENPVNGIAALHNILFGTLRDLNDPKKAPDLERAKLINETAQTIINAAKVEVEALKIIGGSGSGFIPVKPLLPSPKSPHQR